MQEVIEGLTRPFDDDELRPDRVRPLDAAAGRARHRGRPAPALPRQPLDGQAAHRAPHRGARGRDAGRHAAPARRGGRAHAPDPFPRDWEYTVEKVAVNAVMAGARPEYFPVILALAATGVSARGSSSSSLATMAVVNGPVRHEIGMNVGHRRAGPLQPRQRDDRPRLRPPLAEPARAARSPGLTYMGSQGNNYAYNSVTFAENEERSPWEPFHVQHGFRPTDSAVSVFTGLPLHRVHPGPPRAALARARPQHAARHGPAHARPPSCWIPSPPGSSSTAAASRRRMRSIDWLYDNARMPAGEYWDYQLVQNYIYPRATFGEEPWASSSRRRPRS